MKIDRLSLASKIKATAEEIPFGDILRAAAIGGQYSGCRIDPKN
jgi:hypothetical protein